MKTILVFPSPLAMETPKLFFESPHHIRGFQKNNFVNENCSLSSVFRIQGVFLITHFR